MALSIKLSTFVDAGYTGQLARWILTETGTGAQIDSHDEPGPHGQVYNFSFVNNIRDIVYTVSLYAIPPGGGIGALIKAHDVTVSTSTIIFDTDIEIIVGHGTAVDPNDNDDTTPVIPRLIGRQWKLHHRSRGQLLIDREPEYERDTILGTAKLLGGVKFDMDDVYIIKFELMYVVNPLGSVSGGQYTGVELVTADRAVVPGDMGKLFIIEQDTAVLTLSLQSYVDYPEKIPIYFHNAASNAAAVNVVILALGLEGIMQNGFNTQKFVLSRGDRAELIILGNQIYAHTNNPENRQRGKLDFMPSSTMINRLPAEGQEVNAADYPGLAQSLALLFDPSQLIGTSASWNFAQDQWVYVNYDVNDNAVGGVQRTVYPNKTSFALYNVGGVAKIRIPDWRYMMVRGIIRSGNPDVSRNVITARQIQRAPNVKVNQAVGERGDANGDPAGGGFGYNTLNPRNVLSNKLRIGNTDNNNGLDLAPDNVQMLACVII